MTNEMVVKSKTEIVQGKKKDILALYEVPSMLDKIVKKERTEFLKNLSCDAAVIDSLDKLVSSEEFIVEIPGGMREMLNSGKASFDQSVKHPGSFTPNIRIKGEAGIKGQATIVKKSDSQAITQSLSNLAMMAMIQSIFDKLDIIEGKLEEIKKGQENDRIGSIIGTFKGFMDLYPTFTPEQLYINADRAYIDMQKGLAQIHMQIDEERKKLDGSPTNGWQAFWLSITHPFHNESARYQKYYEDYVYDMQLYNRLILLTDVILFLKGKENIETIADNHNKMLSYCEQHLDKNFEKKMNYLMQGNIDGINHIHDYNKEFKSKFEGILNNSIRIECVKADFKFLKLEDYESEKC